MRLIPNALHALSEPRLTESDPVPPDDRLVAGSVLALNDLYRTQAPRLMRYFARRADPQDVHDLVHDSFVQFSNAFAAPDKVIDQPEAYLNRVATNLLRNRAKEALRRSLAQHIPAEEEMLAGSDMMAALEARDLLDRVQSALMRLAPKTREVFLAHRVDGHRYSDIAKRMELSVKGVEWHMTKAIAHLDRVLRGR